MTVGASGTPTTVGAPVVDQALEPAWVREGSPSTKKGYALAQSFEQMLVGELSRAMTSASGIDGEQAFGGGEPAEGSEEEAPGTSPMGSELSSLIPRALSESVVKAGGLGLATQLTRELEPPSAVEQAQGNGGVEA